jgi:hypothetical protein
MNDYEQTLRQIADASELFSKNDDYYRNAMERTLEGVGFDKFMALYRVGQASVIAAYSELGAFYLDSGRPIATIYLAAAVNAALTRAIRDITTDEPDYEYAGLHDLLVRILADRERSRYEASVGLWRNLYLLGNALAASGYRDTAREAWSAMAKVPGPEPWRARAADALKKSSNGRM